jgi:hypothetical protein
MSVLVLDLIAAGALLIGWIAIIGAVARWIAGRPKTPPDPKEKQSW